MYKKLFKVSGEIIKDPIKFSDIPLGAQKLLRKKGINYVEEGMCADLSNYRGYHWDGKNLTKKTGSSWEFYPKCAYLKEG